MEKDNILGNPVFESYWLSHANAEAVFEWLKEQKPYFGSIGGKSDEIENVLIERREPIINLGLALYAGLNSETALRLFRSGDVTIKKAVLSGPSVMPSVVGSDWIEGSRGDGDAGVLKELLQPFDVELLYRLLSNKNLFSQILVNLYHRGTPFVVLTDEQWLKAIECTISNPQLSRPSGYLEKIEFLPPEHPCQAAWNLYKTVPVHAESARILARLGEQLAPHGDDRVPHAPSDLDVLDTIKRWEVEGDDKHDFFCKCRAFLGRLLKDEELKDSADIALRQAYYGGGGWDSRKPEEVREAFEKDKDKFLDVAIYNLSFYRSNEQVRYELRRCCHDYAFKDEYHDGESWNFRWQYHLDMFDAQHDRLRKHEPVWFPDFDGEIPFEEIGDLSLRAEERLMFLQKQIKAISQELIGTKSEDDSSSWYDDDKASLIDNIKATLDQSNQLVLSKLASVTGWAVFVGIVFAIILIAILRKL